MFFLSRQEKHPKNERRWCRRLDFTGAAVLVSLPMRVGVIGSRKFMTSQSIKDFVRSLPRDSIVISGGCAGPDTWAEEAARAAGLEVSIFLPDLPPKGSPRHIFTEAFYARNRLIAENCDVLHAFVAPDRKGGTEYTIKHALKLGKQVIIHN